MSDSFVAFDLETTGVSPERDGIIQVAAVRVEGGRPVAAWDTLVDPGLPVPPTVERLTGIRTAQLAGQPDPPTAAERLLAFTAGLPLVAHNAVFDVGFLARAAGGPPPVPVYCTLELARLVLPAAGGYRLADLARFLGLGEGRFHDARADAQAVARLFLRLLQRLRELPPAAVATVRALVGDDPLLAPLLAGAGVRAEMRRTRPAAAAFARGGGFADSGEAGEEGGETADAVAGAEDAGERAAALLSGRGPLARLLAGYEERPGQVEMARAVARCLAEGGFLLVEAGTGTGKSLAYLVPAALRARAAGQRVVVATHTIALQEQLWHHDLPLLAALLPQPPRAALLKGRSHYLCLLKWREAALGGGGGGEAARRFYARLAVWLQETETGDRAELALRRQEEQLWLSVAADAGCPGPSCPEAGSCFLLRSRAQAARADLVLVNHALLLADAASGGRLLPEYSLLVCDEAHHLGEEAGRQLGFAVSSEEVDALLWPFLRGGDERQAALEGLEGPAEAARAARAAARHLFAAARQGRRPGEEGDFGTWRLPPGPGLERLREAALDLAEALEALARATGAAGRAAGEAGGEDNPDLERVRIQALEGAARDLRAAAEAAGLPEWAAWVEGGPNGETTVHVSPLWPGALLAELLLGRLEAGVFTSATLTVAGSFENALAELGLTALQAQARCLRVESSFDYGRQALLALPTDLPQPQGSRDEAFTAAAAGFLRELALGARGGCLFLFTSHEMLRDVHRRLREDLWAAGLLPLAQGVDGSRHRLAEAMRENPDTVLFGTASFWEGIDVPGGNLRCVAIVRLPFRPPNDPLHEARLEELERRGEDGFRRLTLPAAVLRFRQGFGRLIRRATDRGAVVVLDPRVVSRWDSYGRCFVESLPGPRLVVGGSAEVLAAVRRWLGGAAGEGEALRGSPRQPVGEGEAAAC